MIQDYKLCDLFTKNHQITKTSSEHESKESKHHVCMKRQKMKVSPFYLNLRYTYQTVSGDVQTTCSQWSADICQRRCWAGCDFEMSQDQAEKWVRSRKRSPLPYIFVVPPNKDRSYWRAMTCMWDLRFLWFQESRWAWSPNDNFPRQEKMAKLGSRNVAENRRNPGGLS